MLKDTIKMLAAEKGMTLRELAKVSEVPYTAIREWNSSMPSALALVKVTTVLGTTVEKVLEGEK